MHPDVEARLLALNRGFYQSFAEEFAETRSGPRPGVIELLTPLPEEATVLDLGCGNGTLAQALVERGHSGRYIGVDQNAHLLAAARESTDHPAADFIEADLTVAGWNEKMSGRFNWVCLLAVLHHIPGQTLRTRLVRQAADLLRPAGRALVSAWNFKAEASLRERIVPWSEIDLGDEQVDAGDYLLDWRRGGRGLRYVHHFTAEELAALAERAGLEVETSLYAGGQSGQLNLVQRWRAPRDTAVDRDRPVT